MTGTFISVIIPIITAPVMSRLFSTSAYGILAIYMSICGLAGVIAYCHFPQAIMFEKEMTNAKQVVWLSLFSTVLCSVAGLAVVLFFALFFNATISGSLGHWYWLMPLSLFLSGITACLTVWANRLQYYKQIASNRVIQALSTAFIQIGVGLIFRHSEIGLMTGLLFGQVLSALLLVRLFYKTPGSIGKPDTKGVREMARKHKNLAIYTTPTEFINNAINQLPIFLLQKFAGVAMVGSFNFTNRILGLPQGLLSSAIVEVFRQKASADYMEKGNCRPIFTKTAKILAGLAFIPLIVILLFGQQLFVWVFGANWAEAGVFAQYLSVLFFFRFIISPLTYMYYLAGRLKEDFILHIIFLLLLVSAFYISDYYLADKKMLLLVYAFVYSAIYLVYFVRSYKFTINE